MITTTTNGSVRKTLASQLDRLDSILDGLSEALNGAVASAVEGAVERAVKQAVGEAVRETRQAVLAEVVSNPDLLAAARTLLPPRSPVDVPADPPEPREPPRSLFRRACDGVQAGLAVAAAACHGAGASVAKRAAAVTSAARSGWRLLRRFRGRLLAECGVGLAAGALTSLAGPWLAVAASAAASFVTTLAVQAASGLRQLFCDFLRGGLPARRALPPAHAPYRPQLPSAAPAPYCAEIVQIV